MTINNPYIKRDKLEILLRLLEVGKETIKKTHILYKVNINTYQQTRYLALALGLGMMEEVIEPYKGYRTTERGRMVIELFIPNQNSVTISSPQA